MKTCSGREKTGTSSLASSHLTTPSCVPDPPLRNRARKSLTDRWQRFTLYPGRIPGEGEREIEGGYTERGG